MTIYFVGCYSQPSSFLISRTLERRTISRLSTSGRFSESRSIAFFRTGTILLKSAKRLILLRAHLPIFKPALTTLSSHFAKSWSESESIFWTDFIGSPSTDLDLVRLISRIFAWELIRLARSASSSSTVDNASLCKGATRIFPYRAPPRPYGDCRFLEVVGQWPPPLRARRAFLWGGL